MYALAYHHNPNVREFFPLIGYGYGLGGLGAVSQQTATIASMAATGVAVSTGLLTSLAILPAVAGPIGAAVAALIGVGIGIAKLFNGCGQTCIEATKIADQAGALIDQAYDAYMNSPVHYKSMQLAYLNYFDTVMAAMDKACSDPALGDAGVRCISDRAATSCAYHTSPGGWQQDGNSASGWTFIPYGANGSGTTCWNSYVGRRDPIANDPTVVPDPTPATPVSTIGTGIENTITSFLPSSITGGGGGGGGISMNVILIGGLALAGLFVMSGD